MPTKKNLGLLFLTIFGVMALTLPVVAAVPGQISFQGQLTDNTGTPVPDASYTMRFSLFDAETGGTRLWHLPDAEEQTIAVTNGIYTVQIGAVETLDSSILNGGTAWLEVSIQNPDLSWETLSPRQPVTSVAYALKAADTDTLEGNSTATLDARYINENQINFVTSAMIQNNAVTADSLADASVGGSKIADNAVTESKINFPLRYSGADLNGGLVHMVNMSDGSSGNYPTALYGGSNGTPGSDNVFGVLGSAPAIGTSNDALALIPNASIGVAGAAMDGYGVVGTSASQYHAAVYAQSTKGYGTYARHTDPGVTAPAVYAQNEGSGDGVLGEAYSSDSAGIHGKSVNGSLAGKFDGDVLIQNASINAARFDAGNHRLQFYNSTGAETLLLDGDAAYLSLQTSSSTTILMDADYLGTGNGRIITDELQITGGSDLSEQFDIEPAQFEISPGMVVSIDPDAPGHLQVSRMAYDKKVAGIVSGANGIKTGMMMGQQGTEADGRHPVALTGRVYCWADAASGAIQPGDLLTTSSVPGHAMRVTDHARANGTILGKAMTALEAGRGLVLVLVSLQ